MNHHGHDATLPDRLRRISTLLGVAVLKVERDLPGHHPTRQVWDFGAHRWVAADEHAGPPGERRPARQRWRLLIRTSDGTERWVPLTSDEVKERVREVGAPTDERHPGRAVLRQMHEHMEEER